MLGDALAMVCELRETISRMKGENEALHLEAREVSKHTRPPSDQLCSRAVIFIYRRCKILHVHQPSKYPTTQSLTEAGVLFPPSLLLPLSKLTCAATSLCARQTLRWTPQSLPRVNRLYHVSTECTMARSAH